LNVTPFVTFENIDAPGNKSFPDSAARRLNPNPLKQRATQAKGPFPLKKNFHGQKLFRKYHC
jgi:hypothetical protein